MLKLAGSALLLLGSAGVGCGLIGRLKQRERTLAALVGALALMERELSFRLPPMEEWLLVAADGTTEPAAGFLRACAQTLDRQNGPLFPLWEREAKERLTALERQDVQILLELGAVLGRYSWEEQKKALVAAGERLSRALTQAQEERRGKGRVYGTLSLAAGALLVIVLI